MNWNRRELLRACLVSLRAQTATRFEIVVVDNGSVDGSVDLVEGLRKEAGMPPVRLIRNRENRGFCAANNQGIALARAPFIALINNDAEADAGWIASLRGAFDGRPEVGMAASKILVHEDPTRIDKVGHLIYPDGQNRGRGSGEIDHGQYDAVEETLWPDGCAAMYRKAMLDRIGGFDEDFFAYADDAELGLRARIAGWKCLYVPAASVRHHRGSTLGLLSSRRLRLIERNRVLLALKLFPWSLLWLNPAYYLARLFSGARAAAAGQGEAAAFPGVSGKFRVAFSLLCGDLQALAMLPRMLWKRLSIRRIRTLSNQETRRLILDHRIPLAVLNGRSPSL